MAEKEIDLRRLVIKAFHMTDVEWGEHNNITTDGHMTVSKEMIDQLVAQDDCIEKIDIQNRETTTDGRTRSWISFQSQQKCLVNWEKELLTP